MFLAPQERPEDFFMKKSFALALLVATFCPAPSAMAQSKEAIEACRDVNPPGVWQDCIKDYEAKLEKLRQDPAWQAEQRRLEEERRRHAEQMELQRREMELRRREIEVLQQRMRPGTNCTYQIFGNTIRSTCD